MLKKIINQLENCPPSYVIAIGFWAVVLLGLIDYVTGPDLAFASFYLIPVAAVAWFAGKHWGLAFSIMCALTWAVADCLSQHVYSMPYIIYWNTLIRFAGFIVVSYSLVALKASLQNEKLASRKDPLTDISNSRAFREALEIEIERARRSRRPISVGYADLDDFKRVNDKYGHSYGDDVLKVTASILRQVLRKGDIVARLGGDEFGILLPETGNSTAKDIIHRVSERFNIAMKRHPTPVTVSIGLAIFNRPPASPDEIIRAADGLMYKVKSSGKNSVTVKIFV